MTRTTHTFFVLHRKPRNSLRAYFSTAFYLGILLCISTLAYPLNSYEQQREELRKQYPKDQSSTLSAAGSSFVALWKGDSTGNPFGAVLLVHGDGQTANWPHTIDVLRNELPKNGWATLSIEMLDSPSPKLPQRAGAKKAFTKEISDKTTDKQKIDETDTNVSAMPESKASPSNNTKIAADLPESIKKTIEETEEANQQRIKASLDFLNSNGQFNIIMLGYGTGAARIIEYANSMSSTAKQKAMRRQAKSSLDRPVRAIILVDAKNSLPFGAEKPMENFAYKDIPVLDIVFGNHLLDQLQATERKSFARDTQITTYIQLKLMEPRNMVFEKENRLSRRVRGFLNKHAKGVEIDKR